MAQPYKLDDSHRIVANDARQWTLQRLRDERDVSEDDERPARPEHLKGEELWSDVGYFPTVEGCCRLYAQRYARTSDEPLLVALAKAAKRLEIVLAELRVSTSAL